jgi:excisionase family DNA binding protein
MPKKQVVVDSSNNPVECFTIGNAAKYVGIPKDQLKLQLYREHSLPHYKVVGRSGKRVIRITKADLDKFVADQEIYGKIADKIKEARKSCVVIKKGKSQSELAEDLNVSRVYMNLVENKKTRISIKRLAQIAKITEKPMLWFLE